MRKASPELAPHKVSKRGLGTINALYLLAALGRNLANKVTFARVNELKLNVGYNGFARQKLTLGRQMEIFRPGAATGGAL